MGLASKLAAAQGQGGQPGGAPPQQQQQWPQQQQQQQWQPPAQQMPGAPGQPTGYPQVAYGQPQYGQMAPQPGYPQAAPQGWPQQQQQYPQPGYGMQQPGYAQQQPSSIPGGAPQQQGMVAAIQAKLQQTVSVNKLQAFYPPARLNEVIGKVSQVDFRQLAQRWNAPVEMMLDLAALALYDCVIYADDSGSMKYTDNGERLDDLKVVVSKVTEVVTLFDSDGISVRFINSANAGDNLRDAQAAADFVLKRSDYEGGTPLGTSLDKRIIQPMLVKPLKARRLAKPILIITVTDGEPTFEPADAIFNAIAGAKKTAAESQYGAGAVAFEFAQVGRDQEAQRFLAKLDNDPKVGKMVDATSYYELEADECAKKGVQLSPQLWLIKLMVGAIDPTYDDQD